MKNRQRIVIALSGGVDSSVAAFLLKKAGHDVIALFMRNWHDETLIKDTQCPWIEDSNDALTIAQQLEIPFQIVDLSKEYKERIVDYMINESYIITIEDMLFDFNKYTIKSSNNIILDRLSEVI